MKKILILSLTTFICTGCSFVDQARIEKKEGIPVSAFLQNDSGSKNTYSTRLESPPEKSIMLLENKAQPVASSGTQKTTMEALSDNLLKDVTIEEADLTLSWVDTEDTLWGASDKDVEMLIDSFFISSDL